MQSKVYVCLEALPSSIEAYLSEADFSGTEIVVLKKLLEEDALTLRELAAKTGKSTGVLDQAVKKLLKKKILSRETINDTPKYVLKSLNSILVWMEEDMKLKQEMMQRRHENFESFVRSLTVGKKRPEMEYFEGIEGMKRAYAQLLERGNDIVQYGPTIYLPEEDPLREFRVQWFRERRNKGIFSRVITHNTPLGRRFQSRDVFEYRKTILVDEDSYPFHFEKLVIGDTVACFQAEEERACFIRYPELAQGERLFFERLWNKKVEHESAAATAPQHQNPAPEPQRAAVPLKTKTLSQLREFFLSKTSIAAFALIGIAAIAVTYGLHQYNLFLNTERIKEKVMSIAATGVLQFELQDIDAVRTREDMQKPEYLKLVYVLNEIRRQNEGLKYVYLLRPIKFPDEFTYIADADGEQMTEAADINFDGVIDEKDIQTLPGDVYVDQGSIPPVETAYIRPTAFDVYHDPQWGDVMSGWAPIKNEHDETVAILGVDMFAEDVEEAASETFAPLYIFVAVFIAFLFIRLAAFNRSLLQELVELCRARQAKLLMLGGLVLALLLALALYVLQINERIDRARENILAIARTGASQFSAEELEQLQVLQDVEKPVYAEIAGRLKDMLLQNDSLKYAYIIRPRRGTTTFEFVADADTYGVNVFEELDYNKDGAINDLDEATYPGLPYDISHIEVLRKGSYHQPVVTEKPYSDQWGMVLSGYAPIKDDSGATAALLAVDADAAVFYVPSPTLLVPIIAYAAALLLYLLFGTGAFRQSMLSRLLGFLLSKRTLYATAFVLMGAYWLTFALYFYTLHLIKEETGKRLMSIAVTAASRIDPDDLEPLRFARDMKREEYQRVFRQLNEIRSNNPEITYAYILRPTDQDGIWEFVADADSNYFIPDYVLDYNQDSQITEEDENVAPGVMYDIAYASPIISALGLSRPVYELTLQDQWGPTIGASAPIVKDGKAIGILGLDIFLADIGQARPLSLIRLLIGIMLCLLLVCLFAAAWNRSKDLN